MIQHGTQDSRKGGSCSEGKSTPRGCVVGGTSTGFKEGERKTKPASWEGGKAERRKGGSGKKEV